MSKIIYDYKMKLDGGALVLGLLMFGLVITNISSLVDQTYLESITGLDPFVKEILLYISSIAGVSFILYMSALYVASLSKRTVTIDGVSLKIPKNDFSSEYVNILLSDIKGSEVKRALYADSLKVHHKGGKVIVRKSWLPDAESFEKIYELILNREIAP